MVSIVYTCYTNGACSVTSKYMWPFNEDLIRFDFETDDAASTLPFDRLVNSLEKSPAAGSESLGSMSSRAQSPVQ